MSREIRLKHFLKQEVSQILRERVNDSRIGFVTITDVTFSKDLKKAFIHYSQIGNEKQKQDTVYGLKSAAKFIKGEVSKHLQIQTIPDIIFQYDPSLERGVNIVNQIKNINQAPDNSDKL